MLNICVFEGDGIGPEIMAPTLRVLDAALAARGAEPLSYASHPAGAGHYQKTGEALPEASVAAARAADAILLSAMGLPAIRKPDGTEITPQIELRFRLGLYAGVRPVRVFPGAPTPLASPRAGEIDFVLVRESTEGLFAHMNEGIVTEDDATELLRITRKTSEKLFDFTFRLAERRAAQKGRPGRVTCVDKANVFRAFWFFREIFEARAKAFPGLATDTAYVDAMAMWMVQRPWDFDVLVTENMFGDILSDLGAGLLGSLGLAPSADIGDDAAVFQPCHGSAPDIAGQGVANPLAMILSGAMMLDWLAGEKDMPVLALAASDIEGAVGRLLAEQRDLTGDLGGTASTEVCADAVIAALGQP
ncbi:isocitrate/isopropylmalate dehydrogenase family protein [Oceanibium sediminis]|uniref:isocitrate/isopropylmalate dehydrogenase family protein n=1 Tax=Oceanibium sediminis TaxID=2026339 RepID=UPI000DD39CBD|nr:isocitrate/isopropylmalate family dehydrogenase [Oceanibium sediminis]